MPQTGSIIARAELLLSLLVTKLRQVGMFDSKTAEYQKETHFPGPFLPYVTRIREQRSRLVAGVFKVDTYLSIRGNRPPHLQAEEFDVNLPSTLGAWCSFPLSIFYCRQDEEPSDRKDRKIFELCSIPQLAAPSVLLIEDVLLGLCGLWPHIWRFTRTGPYRRPSESGKDSLALADLLGRWKGHLEKLSALVAGQNSDQITPFIKAYRGLEDENASHGRLAAAGRANSLLHEALALLEALRSALWAILNPPEPGETQPPDRQVSGQRYEFQQPTGGD